MANVKKGQTVPSPQWWKHLRRYGKRLFWHRQRRAFKTGELSREVVDAIGKAEMHPRHNHLNSLMKED